MDRKNSEKSNNSNVWTDAIACCLPFSSMTAADFPCVSTEEICSMTEMNYAERVAFIVNKFIPNLPLGYAENIERAFVDVDEDPLPTIKTDENLFVAEFNRGFSACSDDYVFSALFETVISAREAESLEKDFCTVTAAKSAAAAINSHKADMLIFYPEKEFSELQKKLILASDVEAYSVCGGYLVAKNFAERAVVTVECESRDLLDFSLTCVGSTILLASCFFSVYADLVSAEEIMLGDKVVFFLPSSRSELSEAARCASKIGLPIEKTVCVGIGNDNVDGEEGIAPDDMTTFVSDLFDEYGYVADPETVACMACACDAIDENDRVAVVLACGNAFDYADEILDCLGERKGNTPTNSLKKLENVTALPLSETFATAFVAKTRTEKKASENDFLDIINDYVTSR